MTAIMGRGDGSDGRRETTSGCVRTWHIKRVYSCVRLSRPQQGHSCGSNPQKVGSPRWDARQRDISAAVDFHMQRGPCRRYRAPAATWAAKYKHYSGKILEASRAKEKSSVDAELDGSARSTQIDFGGDGSSSRATCAACALRPPPGGAEQARSCAQSSFSRDELRTILTIQGSIKI